MAIWNIEWNDIKLCEMVCEMHVKNGVFIVMQEFHMVFYVKYCVKFHVKTETCFALKMCEFVCEIAYEKACEKDNILHMFFTCNSHTLHILFTCCYFICMWNKHVKHVWNVVKIIWKMCEIKLVFTWFFTWLFTRKLLVVYPTGILLITTIICS